MGTRSIVKFFEKYNGKERPIVAVCQQYDGYLEGVGYQLYEYLSKKIIINGIGFDQYEDEYANGIDCLAAQFIRDFKRGAGGLYIAPVDCEDEDYNYDVIYDGKEITIRVRRYDSEPFFCGNVKDFGHMIEREGEML